MFNLQKQFARLSTDCGRIVITDDDLALPKERTKWFHFIRCIEQYNDPTIRDMYLISTTRGVLPPESPGQKSPGSDNGKNSLPKTGCPGYVDARTCSSR